MLYFSGHKETGASDGCAYSGIFIHQSVENKLKVGCRNMTYFVKGHKCLAVCPPGSK